MYVTWPAPLPNGATGEEMALSFDWNRKHRLLVLAPLFSENNTFRHQLFEIMRQLSLSGIDCYMPDLPGCNESAQPLALQTLAHWRMAASVAADHFRASHVFSLRSSASIAPATLPGWCYAPTAPAQTLRTLLRARIIAASEAGMEESSEGLLETGLEHGLDLGGWHLGPALIAEMHSAENVVTAGHNAIAHDDIGGSPLWLRAEPGTDAGQAARLVQIMVDGIIEP